MIGIAWSSSRKDGWLFPARRWASTGPGTIRGLLVFERQRRRAGPLLQCSDEQLPRLVRGAAGQRLDVHDPRRGDGLPRVVLDGQPFPVDDGDDDVGAVGVVDEVLLDGGEAVGLVVLGQGRPHAHSHCWFFLPFYWSVPLISGPCIAVRDVSFTHRNASITCRNARWTSVSQRIGYASHDSGVICQTRAPSTSGTGTAIARSSADSR